MSWQPLSACAHTHTHTIHWEHKFTDIQGKTISDILTLQYIQLQNYLLTFLHRWRRRHLSANLGSLSHQQQWRYVKSSLFLCSSAVLSHTHLWPFIAFLSLLSFFPSLSLPVAGSNKGLTGRAWRSWLLDGKGESHSWAGQASSLAKVMSCVFGGRRGAGGGGSSYLTQSFFSFLTATWFGEGTASGSFDKVWGAIEKKG